MTWYTFDWTTPVLYGNFGFLGNLVPLLIVVGFAWNFSVKVKDMLIYLFPFTLMAKLMFPFMDTSFVYITFALFILNILGSANDILGEVKALPKKVIYGVKGGKAGERFRKDEYNKKIEDKYQSMLSKIKKDG